MNLIGLMIAGLAITSVIVQGQNKIQGYILDKKTSEPLSYATIGALNQQYGSYTDTTGLFILNFLNENDSLKVSYLGYKGLNTTVRDLQSSPKIFLEANPVQIKEIVVNSKKQKSKKMEIGYFSKKPVKTLFIGYSIIATFIPFPKQEGNIVLKSVKFKYNLSAKNSALRIHVLKVMNSGEPGDDMIDDNIIFNNYRHGQNEVAIIDISRYYIIMPQNGVFIGLEWIDIGGIPESKDEKPVENGPRIGTTQPGDSSKSTWVKTYNYPWHKSPLPFTFAIGLSVVNYKE